MSLKKHFKLIALLCFTFTMGILVMSLFFPELEEFPYQHQAYADQGFIQSYDSKLRMRLFEDVDNVENNNTLLNLRDELSRTLYTMRARLMYELKLSNINNEEYNPYYPDSKAYDPDQHDIYMHTEFFSRLSEWQNKWGMLSKAEKEKINKIESIWSEFDMKAKQMGLVKYNWGTARSSNSIKGIHEFYYTPHQTRYNMLEPIISHFEGLNRALDGVNPVFIDFARDADMGYLKLIERTHEEEAPDTPYSPLYFKGKSVDLTNLEETEKLVSLLRNISFQPTAKPKSIVEEDFVLRGEHFQMHFYEDNLVYIIWNRELVPKIELVYDRNYYNVDENTISELTQLLSDLYKNSVN